MFSISRYLHQWPRKCTYIYTYTSICSLFVTDSGQLSTDPFASHKQSTSLRVLSFSRSISMMPDKFDKGENRGFSCRLHIIDAKRDSERERERKTINHYRYIRFSFLRRRQRRPATIVRRQTWMLIIQHLIIPPLVILNRLPMVNHHLHVKVGLIRHI